MPCTVKKTFEAAHDTGCHLIVQVKANQPGLLERVEQICQSDTPAEAVASRDYGRCRQETRTVLVFDARNHFAGSEFISPLSSRSPATAWSAVPPPACGR